MADNTDRKAELIAELNRARSRATAYRRGLSGDLKVSSKAKANIARNRGAWLLGAGLVGLIIAKIPPRTKKVPVSSYKGDRRQQVEATGKAGLMLGILKLLVDATKPVFLAWMTKRLGEAVSVGKEVKHKVNKVDAKT